MKRKFLVPSMKLAVAIAGIALIGTYAACKKNTSQPVAKFTIADDSTTCGPGNSSNPDDSVGYWHNKYFDTIIVQNDTSLNDNVNTLEAYVNYYGRTWPGGDISSTARTVYSSITYSSYTANASTYMSGEISGLSISSLAKNYLNTLFSTTLNPKNYASNSTYCDVRSNVVSLEATISADKSLSSSDQQLLLSACAVARYTIYINWGGYQPNINAFVALPPSVLWDIWGLCDTWNRTGNLNQSTMVSAVASACAKQYYGR